MKIRTSPEALLIRWKASWTFLNRTEVVSSCTDCDGDHTEVGRVDIDRDLRHVDAEHHGQRWHRESWLEMRERKGEHRRIDWRGRSERAWAGRETLAFIYLQSDEAR